MDISRYLRNVSPIHVSKRYTLEPFSVYLYGPAGGAAAAVRTILLITFAMFLALILSLGVAAAAKPASPTLPTVPFGVTLTTGRNQIRVLVQRRLSAGRGGGRGGSNALSVGCALWGLAVRALVHPDLVIHCVYTLEIGLHFCEVRFKVRSGLWLDQVQGQGVESSWLD